MNPHSPEGADAVVVCLEALECGEASDGGGGQRAQLVVADVQVLQRHQTLEGVVLDLKQG